MSMQRNRVIAPRSLIRSRWRRELHDRGLYGYQQPRTFTLPDFTEDELASRADQPSLVRLVDSYRRHGHRAALLDPLKLTPRPPVKALDPRRYGFRLKTEVDHAFSSDVRPPKPTLDDPQRVYDPRGIFYINDAGPWTIDAIAHRLQDVYCRALGFEYMHLPNKHEREWIARTLELSHAEPMAVADRIAQWQLLERSESFDRFLHKRFPTVKRYGLQGAESMMVALERIFSYATHDGIDEAVLVMPHRGRLNVLAQLLDFDIRLIAHKMKGQSELPEEQLQLGFTGDVLSHLFTSPTLSPKQHDLAHPLTVHLLPNPSFLEAVNPVGLGLARALQVQSRAADAGHELGDNVLSIAVHGDGAWAGQGVVAETLNLQSLPHYNVGGTVHLVVNNQIGFTTPAEQGRTGFYATDLAKAIESPVIHVNGDHSHEVARAVKLAMTYRKQFRKDIVIDLICYRRLGHNELDEPSFTNPQLYRAIQDLKTVPRLAEEALIADGHLTAAEAKAFKAKALSDFEAALEGLDSFVPPPLPMRDEWKSMTWPIAPSISPDTGVDRETLVRVGQASVESGDVATHPRLEKLHIAKRLQSLETGRDIDFATAEALAFGSLLLDGCHVRLSGQDVGRGTFSQRHVLLQDQKEQGKAVVPLNSLDAEGRLEIANSPLSEFAILGFEQGLAWASPKILAIWELQFGDFASCAQVMIDTYIASGEAKWGMQSSLVILLPHGADIGAGPEHSSGRIERFLQLSNEPFSCRPFNPNMHFAHPTTAAQYFHLLRRQMVRPYRKPLIVFSAKSMLRMPATTATFDELAPGTSWQPVLDDPSPNASEAQRVVFLTGQLYYKLEKERQERKLDGKVAFIRLEELSPFPYKQLERLLERYTNAKSYVWAQEEPENAGAYAFVAPRFAPLLGGKELQYVGRPAMAAPASGIASQARAQQVQLTNEVFEGL